MKAKQLMDILSKLPDDTEIFIENKMGYPAYYFIGQKFRIGFGESANVLSITEEVDS